MVLSEPKLLELFSQALECSTADARAAYLDQVCRGDSGLRAKLDELLAAHREAGSFLREPSAARAETIDMPVELAGMIIGPYKLIEPIGEGGMGTVWMAQQTEPVKRLVAVKLIKAGMDSRQVVARFEAERQALALMDHVNIARVLDAGQTLPACTRGSPRPYFIMELVKGVPITRYCDEHHLTPRQRLELFIPVCHAIQHAHQKGIIHRDLKPSNVLVALYDGKPVPKIIDFGVAKAIGQPLTEKTLVTGLGAIVGTLEYMSPEQAEVNQLDVDTRSDIYSLGVLLYELLTGSPPFTKKDLEKRGMFEMLRVIREQEPAKPSTRLSTADGLPTLASNRGMEPAKLARILRGELDWIVMKALEKDRNRRYETANGLAHDLQRYLADEPVLACPPSPGYRMRKFARRNKASLAISGLVLALILLLGGAIGWAVRDRGARHATLNQQMELALDETSAARQRALTMTGNPYQWQAALAAAFSELKRAEGIAAHDKHALPPGVRERLKQLQDALSADENDFRFVARIEEIRLGQTELDDNVDHYRMAESVPHIKDAFKMHYGVEFGTSPSEEVSNLILSRPEPIRQHLLAALDFCGPYVQRKATEEHQWVTAVLKASDTDAWRQRLRAAVATRDWAGLERVIREASLASQSPNFLLLFALRLPPEAAVQRLTLLQQIQQAHPADFWANHELGMALHYCRPSRAGEAIRYFTAAVALRPQSPGVHLNLGNALIEKRDHEGALWAYGQVVTLAPNYVKPHLQIARTHTVLGDELWSKQDFNVATIEYQKAVAAYRRAVALAPKKASLPILAAAHIKLGIALATTGDRDAAKTQFQEAINASPNWPLAHYNLGFYWLEKDDDAAIAKFREAIKLNADYLEAHRALGLTLMRKGRIDEAIVEFREMTRLSPGQADYHYQLGNALFNKRRFDEAIVAYRVASRLKPDHASARYELGHALREKGAIDEAIDAYRELVRLKLADADAKVFITNQLKERAWQLATQANSTPEIMGRAAVLASEIVVLEPNSALNWNRLGVIRYWVGDWKGCIEAQRRSIELDDQPKGGNSFQWFLLSMAHSQLGEEEKAREWYGKAAEWMDKNLPKDQELLRFRAEASQLMGKKGE